MGPVGLVGIVLGHFSEKGEVGDEKVTGTQGDHFGDVLVQIGDGLLYPFVRTGGDWFR